MRYLEVGTRALLAVVFVAALVGKVSGRASYAAFVRSLRQMDVVPVRVVRPAAAATVVAEAMVVLLLLVPARWGGIAGSVLAGVLLAAFTAAVLATVRRGRRAPCRCFGASDTPLGWRHVVRNLGLTAAAALGLAASVSSGELQLAAASLAVFAGLLAGALVAALDELVALFRSPA
ncbi:MauE/DoxX family redox-associated membrane protein [Micromonospora sp. NPDC092111]|uniref:MauE/DoxX family redox-associated membrane protein n=1 Tax=Micromonospora sp. NPDC092111 TaxID=3364289 RepID=UPI0038012966